MGNPFLRGPYAYGLAAGEFSGGGTIGFIAGLDDGAGSVVEPNWRPLVISSVLGLSSELDEGKLSFLNGGQYALEGRAEVSHSYGRYVIFGYSADEEPIREFGRAQCNSDTFVFVITPRRIVEIPEGTVVQFFISSDFEWEPFEWRNAEVLGATAND